MWTVSQKQMLNLDNIINIFTRNSFLNREMQNSVVSFFYTADKNVDTPMLHYIECVEWRNFSFHDWMWLGILFRKIVGNLTEYQQRIFNVGFTSSSDMDNIGQQLIFAEINILITNTWTRCVNSLVTFLWVF